MFHTGLTKKKQIFYPLTNGEHLKRKAQPSEIQPLYNSVELYVHKKTFRNTSKRA